METITGLFKNVQACDSKTHKCPVPDDEDEDEEEDDEV